MDEKAKQVAKLLKLLANENRLMILCALIESPMAVSKIAERVPDITQSALSQHLALFKEHGVLDREKSGQSVIYSIADGRVTEVIATLKKYYCGDGII